MISTRGTRHSSLHRTRHKPLFKITLLQTNGSRQGVRYEIDSSPFVIGRNEQCDIAFTSRSVSRKHCMIVFNDTDVLIKDLSSRNGTLVGDEPISPNAPQQLSHHDTLRIGKYTFRISIRDAESRQPYRPELIDLSTLSGPVIGGTDQHKATAQLLDELDAIASKLDLQHDSDTQSASEGWKTKTRQLPPSAAKKKPPVTNDPAGAADDEESSMIEQVETRVDRPTDAGTAKSSDGETPEGHAENAPKKIPEHLRPKGPKDSQSAASAALRNLFVR